MDVLTAYKDADLTDTEIIKKTKKIDQSFHFTQQMLKDKKKLKQQKHLNCPSELSRGRSVALLLRYCSSFLTSEQFLLCWLQLLCFNWMANLLHKLKLFSLWPQSQTLLENV